MGASAVVTVAGAIFSLLVLSDSFLEAAASGITTFAFSAVASARIGCAGVALCTVGAANCLTSVASFTGANACVPNSVFNDGADTCAFGASTLLACNLLFIFSL